MKDDRFVGRVSELRLLGEFLARQSPGIAVIYGRRRIGKSLLIQKALAGRRALTFEGLENQPKRAQIDAFLFQLARQGGESSAGGAASNWREALDRVGPLLRKGPTCLVLDEFQWMANYRRDLVSDLKMIWEQSLSQIPGAKLILCGSVASFMTTRVVRSSALYGRVDLELHLKGFHLDEARELLRGKGLDEVIEASLYFDGVPKYLDLVRPYTSVLLGVEEMAFRENGYFVEEYGRIFSSHFGRNPDFRKIIEALAARPEGLFRKALAERAGVEEGGTLSVHCADLESAGFISSVTPCDKGDKSRLIKYLLSDAYMRFYHAFIRPNLRKIRSGAHRDLFTRLAQTGRFHAWRGRAFEHLCLAHTRRIAEILGFSGIDFSVGPYFRAPGRGKDGLQIDLLFSRADNVISLCEMNCSVAPIGIGIAKEVERKVELLHTEFPSKTIQRVLVVHGQPSRELSQSGYFYRIIKAAELAS
jgi:uncharacterized protein